MFNLRFLRQYARRAVLIGGALLAFAAAPFVNAAPITFDLVWDGTPFGNSASAIGSITLEESLLPNPGSSFGSLASFGVSALSVTVTGASAGNGTFGLSDFSSLVWNTGGNTLDFSQELLAQGLFDFNLFNAVGSGAPTGVAPFVFTTNEGTADSMQLLSMTPQVPVPATLALLAVGMLGLAARRRR